MNKKLTKTLITVLCFAIVASLSAVVFAGTTIDGVTVNPDTSSSAAGTAGTVGNKIVGIIKVIGIIASVAIIMVVGIKYMMGSAEEKAEYKKTLIPLVIGAILLFGASVFAEQLANIAQNLFN